MTQNVGYYGDVSGRNPSRSIWARCPEREIFFGERPGRYFYDDFHNFAQHITDQDTQKYDTYIDTGVTFKQLATIYGEVQLAGNDADNDEGWLTTGGNTGCMGVISDTAGSNKRLWFECRIQKVTVTDNTTGLFVGLSEEGLAAANTMVDDTCAMASKDFIGFYCVGTDGDNIDFVYRKAGQAMVTKISGLTTLTAATYVKLGFAYYPGGVPSQPSANKIAVYVDGVEQTTYVTATNIATATFPDGEELALLFGGKTPVTAESKANIDWWKFCQDEIE